MILCCARCGVVCAACLLARCASACFRSRAFLPPRRRFLAAVAPSAAMLCTSPSPAPGRSAVTCHGGSDGIQVCRGRSSVSAWQLFSPIWRGVGLESDRSLSASCSAVRRSKTAMLSGYAAAPQPVNQRKAVCWASPVVRFSLAATARSCRPVKACTCMGAAMPAPDLPRPRPATNPIAAMILDPTPRSCACSRDGQWVRHWQQPGTCEYEM